MNRPDALPSPSSTISLQEACARTWDVAVVGAGPAGSLAAREAAGRGARVLLLDRATFPRAKVCGGCLNGASLSALHAVGLGNLPSQLGAISLERFEWHRGSQVAVLPLPAGVAVSRLALDAALIQAAIQSGAALLSGVEATLQPPVESACEIQLQSADERGVARAEVALAADGLAGRFLRHLPEFSSTVRLDARIGAGIALDCDLDFYQPGTIYMTCGKSGYAGLVRLEDGRLNIAAALDREEVRRMGGPGAAVAHLLDASQVPVPGEILDGPWRGTPPLTRRPGQIAGHRVLVLGDAAGYIEPFTGEGMAWAMQSAKLAAPLAVAGAASWTPAVGDRWTRLYQCSVVRRQRVCLTAARLLRSSRATAIAMMLLKRAPWLASPFTGAINRGS